MKRIFPQLLLLAVSLFSFQQTHAQESLPDLVKRVKPAVVAIATYDADGEAIMTGSGFFLRPGEVILPLPQKNRSPLLATLTGGSSSVVAGA